MAKKRQDRPERPRPSRAAARITELQAEIKTLQKTFRLPDTAPTDSTAPTFAATEVVPGKPVRKRRKKMTAEQRKAASARMKAYWASKKKG